MKKLIITKQDYQLLKSYLIKIQAAPGSGINKLKHMLQGLNPAALPEPTEVPSDVITMNSQVKIEFQGTQKTEAMYVVYPDQADAAQRRISIFSPLAMALLGRRQGDRVSVSTPSRTVNIQIDRILYQPQAAGDCALQHAV